MNVQVEMASKSPEGRGGLGTGRKEQVPVQSRLRLVQLLNSLAVGGAERMALNLALAQKEAGHEPLLYCIESEGTLAQEARANGIPVICFHKKAGKSPGTVLQIARALRRDRADILHTHNPPAHYYGAPAAWLARIPVVNTRHSPISARGGEYRERYFKWLLSLTGAVVFVARNGQERILPQWSGKKIFTRLIPNGIPVARFQLERPRRDNSKPFVFGAIGRLAPVKCYDLLIDAFRSVLEREPNCELHIVGEGPLAEELRSHVIRCGLQDRAFVKPATLDVAEALRSFDAFVISSSSEGLPMVVLEAMAAGLVIVATRVGGIPEAVQEGKFGWFCAPGDREALAEVMLTARNCADLEARGRMAAEYAVAKYDASVMARQYLEVFAPLVRRPKAANV